MTETPQATDAKPTDLGDLLLADKSGTELRNIVNELSHYNGLLKAEINQGLSREDFKAKQGLVEAIQLALGYVQKFWTKNHQGTI